MILDASIYTWHSEWLNVWNFLICRSQVKMDFIMFLASSQQRTHLTCLLTFAFFRFFLSISCSQSLEFARQAARQTFCYCVVLCAIVCSLATPVTSGDTLQEGMSVWKWVESSMVSDMSVSRRSIHISGVAVQCWGNAITLASPRKCGIPTARTEQW